MYCIHLTPPNTPSIVMDGRRDFPCFAFQGSIEVVLVVYKYLLKFFQNSFVANGWCADGRRDSPRAAVFPLLLAYNPQFAIPANFPVTPMPPAHSNAAILSMLLWSLDREDRVLYHRLIAPDVRPVVEGRRLVYRDAERRQARDNDPN